MEQDDTSYPPRKVLLVVRGTIVDEGSKVVDKEENWEEWVCLDGVSVRSVLTLADGWEKQVLGRSGCDKHGRFIVRNQVDASTTLALEFEKSTYERKTVEFAVNAEATWQGFDLFIELSPLSP
jgi:hypothetical protein